MRQAGRRASGSGGQGARRLALQAGAVRIEPYAAADAPALARLANDAELARMMASIRLPFTAADARRRIALTRDDGRPPFLAAVRVDGVLAGEAGLGPEAEPGVLLWLGTAHRGRGHGRAALSALLDHAFDTVGLPAVTAEVYEDNAVSRAFFARAGFVEAGRGVDREHPLRRGPAPFLRLRRALADCPEDRP